MLKKKRGVEIPLKADDKETIDEISSKIAKIAVDKEAAKSDKEKLRLQAALDEAKAELKLVRTRVMSPYVMPRMLVW